ncbi:hypothetical protein FXF51_06050 [Nonomuraea sp. PA05]|uniref:hypothetical protein n=1 Tax=Nonomuraea sp. PA05 TaxID=2604466 RepID=UPI0011D75CA1|nr:hypothetical protein [Nonomuraea sp. PA05]TYB69722.1 hypothetical protein FXF51_06050 [Nonomuraea sp. PA05]
MQERELSITGPVFGPTVKLGDHELSRALRGLTIRFQAGERPAVEAELLIDAIEVADLGVRDSEVVLSMPDAARDALIALGWTPPAGDR